MAGYIWGIIWTRTGELDGESPSWYESKHEAIAEWNTRDYKYWPSPLVRAPIGPYDVIAETTSPDDVESFYYNPRTP